MSARSTGGPVGSSTSCARRWPVSIVRAEVITWRFALVINAAFLTLVLVAAMLAPAAPAFTRSLVLARRTGTEPRSGPEAERVRCPGCALAQSRFARRGCAPQAPGSRSLQTTCERPSPASTDDRDHGRVRAWARQHVGLLLIVSMKAGPLSRALSSCRARRSARSALRDRPSGRSHGSGRWSGAHLSIASSSFEDQVSLETLRWRSSLRGCQAARRKVAPAGAKGWLRVSMCQIASVSLRARSIWATLAPRWRPRRRLVAW
jgi:hypothetical protein